MRWTTRLLAATKPATQFLEPHAPTGLTGLYTHPSPRATLIHIYTLSLSKLSALPSHSLYRQSTEALTKSRLAIVESVKPAGYDAYLAASKKFLDENPAVLNTSESGSESDPVKYSQETIGGRSFVHTRLGKEHDVDKDSWDGETDEVGAFLEGPRSREEREKAMRELGRGKVVRHGGDGKVGGRVVHWDNVAKSFSGAEPPLSVEQISEIETKIGAGLIEEVIQVAEGELKLIDSMEKAKVWEDLEEKPVEGQWAGFKRDAHT